MGRQNTPPRYLSLRAFVLSSRYGGGVFSRPTPPRRWGRPPRGLSPGHPAPRRLCRRRRATPRALPGPSAEMRTTVSDRRTLRLPAHRVAGSGVRTAKPQVKGSRPAPHAARLGSTTAPCFFHFPGRRPGPAALLPEAPAGRLHALREHVAPHNFPRPTRRRGSAATVRARPPQLDAPDGRASADRAWPAVHRIHPGRVRATRLRAQSGDASGTHGLRYRALVQVRCGM